MLIKSRTPQGSVAYQLQRQNQNEFNVQVDFDQSQVNNGGYGLTFNDSDVLEIRDWSGDQNFDIEVAPNGNDNLVWVNPADSHNTPEGNTLDEIDFGAPIKPEDSRKVALQVASAVIGVPFLDRMLEQSAE